MSNVTALPFAAWPTSRKVATGVFALAGYAALACAAVYLSGALFLVLNKADPRQAHFTSIVRYWHLYAEDSQLRRKLELAISVSGFGLLVLLPAGLVSAARPRRALHGDARFASPAEAERAGLTGGDGEPGILIGRHRGRFLSLRGQLSVMLSAPTRSGKGVASSSQTCSTGPTRSWSSISRARTTTSLPATAPRTARPSMPSRPSTKKLAVIDGTR